MLPFQPPFSNQNQVRGGNDPSLNRLPSSSSAVANQFGFNNPQILMPKIGEFQNQNALLSTLLVQQQLIQGLQNNLMAALTQQGVIHQFPGQQLNLLGGLQNPNLMPLQQGGLLGRPPLSQNPNQMMGCSPNVFPCSQNPNFASNSQLPVTSSGNPSPVFPGNANPKVTQSINNYACLETQLASKKSQQPTLQSPMQNNPNGRQWPQNLNQMMGCSPNGFPCSQNPNFASNSRLPVMSSGNPSPVFPGNGNPQVTQSINNSACLETQITSKKLQQPTLQSPLQNNMSSGRQWPQNLNQMMGCSPNGFPCSQNPNFASNSQLPVMSSGNPSPVFLGNGNPQVTQSINNSACLETQIASKKLLQPTLPSPIQNNQSSGRQWPQNLNQMMGCSPNGFPCSQNPNFASNSQLPVMNSGNPNPVFPGNGNPQVTQSINNSACFETQIPSKNLQQPALQSPMQNNQSSGRQCPQLTHRQVGGKYFSSNFSENVASNNFKTKFNGSGKMEQSHMRFQKPHSYGSKNAWKKEGSFPRNDRRGQRQRNERNTKLSESNYNTSITCKRPLTVIYSENEVQQWREARKKNFPSRTNIEKKLIPSSAKEEDMDSDAKARRQQLKEILAKQAELGVQIAEIPSNYLTESEEQTSRNMNTKEASNINTNNKRGRFRREDRKVKKLKIKDETLPVHVPVVKKREPTLLRKLLNADIRRDNSHLLQAFRFFVLNSFFKNSPDKPLVFPITTAKDAAAPKLQGVEADKLLPIEDAAAPKLTQSYTESAATSIVKNGNDEEIESDSDDIDGASDVVCEAVGEKSEEGEITD